MRNDSDAEQKLLATTAFYKSNSRCSDVVFCLPLKLYLENLVYFMHFSTSNILRSLKKAEQMLYHMLGESVIKKGCLT